jgi:uncharacterized protein (TIGR02186 family)
MRWLATLLCLALGATAAKAGDLTTLLSTNRVEIHSTYTGAEIVVFGALEPEGALPPPGGVQIAIIVTGPRGVVTVQRKARLGPVWLNRHKLRFDNSPGYVALLASEPLAGIADKDTLRRLGMDGVGDIGKADIYPDTLIYRTELTRLRKEEGLYRRDEAGISFFGGRLFQARITLPASAPLGRYYVSTHAFRDGTRIAESANEFFLTKTGFEAVVAREARDRPWLYGLVAILVALGLGWLSSVAFRRD